MLVSASSLAFAFVFALEFVSIAAELELLLGIVTILEESNTFLVRAVCGVVGEAVLDWLVAVPGFDESVVPGVVLVFVVVALAESSLYGCLASVDGFALYASFTLLKSLVASKML